METAISVLQKGKVKQAGCITHWFSRKNAGLESSHDLVWGEVKEQTVSRVLFLVQGPISAVSASEKKLSVTSLSKEYEYVLHQCSVCPLLLVL